MNEPQQNTNDQPGAPAGVVAPPDGEFYLEPTPLGKRDVAGVMLALVALALIGAGGYIWLNPELSLASLAPGPRPPAAAEAELGAPAPHEHGAPNAAAAESSASPAAPAAPASAVADPPAAPTGTDAPPARAGVPAAPPAAAAPDMSCPQCGMHADRSLAHVVAHWSDGSTTHHDCWDCTFAWGRANGITLQEVQVMAHGSRLDAPQWLQAPAAVFLYGTSRIKGSMPPYVAAFDTRAAATAAQPELGGEVLDWEGLQAKFK
jgi:hypothetical protein